MSLLDEYKSLSTELNELTQKGDLDPIDDAEIRSWMKELWDKMTSQEQTIILRPERVK